MRSAFRDSNIILLTDAYRNQAARLGYGTAALSEQTDYPITRLTQNYQLWTALYRSSWIVQNIVDMVPEDMTKHWCRLDTQLPPESLDRLTRIERSTRLRDAFRRGLKWGRLYGGAAGLIQIQGHGNMLDEPLDLSTVLPDSFRGLYIVDRWAGVYPDSTTVVSDLDDPDVGLPEYYEIRDDTEQTVVRVHHSRVVRFTGRELPTYESVAELYWGQSELEAIFTDLRRRDNAAENIGELLFKARISVEEIDGMNQLFGAGAQKMRENLINVAQAQSVLESNFGTRLIEKGSKYQVHQFTFSGVADIYDRVMMDIAGAARMPMTKLFGRSPGGLTNSHESEIEDYCGMIEGKQAADLEPALNRVYPVMMMSALGAVPDDWRLVFNPIRSAKIEDMANIADKRTGAVLDAYDHGVISLQTAMKELRGMASDTGLFTNISDEDIESAKGKWVWNAGPSPIAIPPPTASEVPDAA